MLSELFIRSRDAAYKEFCSELPDDADPRDLVRAWLAAEEHAERCDEGNGEID